MKWIAMLCTLFMLTSCYRNGRDALESHQVIAEPKTLRVHWTQDPLIDVTEERCNSTKPCQRLVN